MMRRGHRAMGRPASCLPRVLGPYLTILGVPGAGRGVKACRQRGGAAESGQAGDAGAKLWRLSAPRPPATQHSPVLLLGLPLHWPGAAGRAGTGRGAADPLGELTHFSF